MAVTYQLTESEFVAAQRTLFGAVFGRRALILLVAAALVLGGTALSQSAAAAAVLLAAVAFLLFFWLWLLPFSWRRLYRRLPAEQRTIVLDFSAEGLVVETPVSQGKVRWSAYSHYLENKVLLLLMQPSRLAVPIPKRAFPPEELARFRALMEAHLPKGRPAKRSAGDGSTAQRS
jgi:hypothetical protein